MRSLTLYATIFLGIAIAGCSDDSESTPPKELAPARGVTIERISLYQGLERSLMADGAETPAATVPLVAGRDGVIRVFYQTDDTYDDAEVVARLELEGAEEPLEVTGKLTYAASSNEDIGSTINFAVPGTAFGETLSYSVALLQKGGAGEDAAWPSDGKQTVPVEGPHSTLRVSLVPIQYDFDGSSRLPDVSESIVEQYRTRLQQLYPVSAVEITVHEPIPWAGELAANGDGWDEIIDAFVDLRARESISDDVYYYGVFNPEEQLSDYCFAGCLLGATLLNNSPSDVGDVGLRLALGVGYPEQSVDTMAHELGHAHGRKHANCGSGLAAGSVDSQYPHEEGQIGVWGLDPSTMQLYPPSVTSDIMGYCEFQWVSDYTFAALLHRGALVNLPRWKEPPRTRRTAVVRVEGGRAHWTRTISSRTRGKQAATIVASGKRLSVEAAYYPFDHLPGGLAFVPIDEEPVDAIEIEVEGARLVVAR